LLWHVVAQRCTLLRFVTGTI
jgi:hypothetical protein